MSRANLRGMKFTEKQWEDYAQKVVGWFGPFGDGLMDIVGHPIHKHFEERRKKGL